jgi:hypothetical protein
LSGPWPSRTYRLTDATGGVYCFDLIAEALAEKPDPEFERAKRELEEIYQRFKFSSSFDEQSAGGESRDPICEFLQGHPSCMPVVAFAQADVIIGYVNDRLSRAERIAHERPLSAIEREEGPVLLRMLDEVNAFFKFDKGRLKEGTTER